MKKETAEQFTKEEFRSLESAEKDTKNDIQLYGGYTLKDIIERVRVGKLSVEIRANDNGPGRIAVVKGGEKVLFSTRDEGEVEIFKLIKEGKHVPIAWPRDDSQ